MTLVDNIPHVPSWDVQQYEVILDAPSSWQLVVAGPGAGKSAVACQRVAHLVDEEIPPSRILLVSFTRTAVAELRDRIVSYAVAGEAARAVRISTVDSHAWSLRNGFDDEPFPKEFGDRSYGISIERTVALFRERQPNLLDFMSRLEHLIIDEAQDVLGLRADLMLEMLKHVSLSCGVTILADPAQAIYGFTSDSTPSGQPEPSLLERLNTESPRPLVRRELRHIHRIKDVALADLFVKTREEVELTENPNGYVARVQHAIRKNSAIDPGVTSYASLPEFLIRTHDDSMLVLFRRRADVLFASSYCSQAGVEHRLRMADISIGSKPWLGWLLGDCTKALLSKQEFGQLWDERSAIANAPFVGEHRDTCWNLLHRLAAGARSNTIDLVHLRGIIARPRPPIELCYRELGHSGPILGTIHASKGREADTVVLVIPEGHDDDDADNADSATVFEEGRVYYVGATRARKLLVTAGASSTRVSRLDSGRVFHFSGRHRAQFEVGRDGDVESLAHLAWSGSLDVQRVLASCVGRSWPVRAVSLQQHNYERRIVLEQQTESSATSTTEIGQLGVAFEQDLKKLWSRIDTERNLRPPGMIPHLHLVAVATVGLTEQERGAVGPPFNQSGLALVPVVKGFPMIQFSPRKKTTKKRSRR